MAAQPLPDFDAWWDYDNPAATEAKFREHLTGVEKSADSRDYVLQLRTQIGRTLSLQGKFAAAHALLDGVERDLPPGDTLARVRYLLERGRTFRSAKEPAKAAPLFQEAFAMGKRLHDDGYAIDAAHMMALVSAPADAGRWHHDALTMAEASPQPRGWKWRGSLLNNMGWALHDEGKYPEALAHFERALAARLETGKAAEIRIARWCIGRVLRSLKRYPEALKVQQDLQAEFTAAKGEDPYVQEELGELLLVTQGRAAARPHFARAYELLAKDTWFAANETTRLQRLKDLGQP